MTGWAGLGKEGRAGQGKEKILQAIVEETLQNVVKKHEKKELGRVSHFFEVNHCDGFTELIISAVFKK